MTNTENCGGCGHECAFDEICCHECRPPDALLFDFYNCGSCGVVCSDILEGGYVTCCDGECVDISEDIHHCGECGNACEAGQACGPGPLNTFWCTGGGDE